MQTMHLFAGAGGGLLADLILGHTPLIAVELDKYACRVLRERAADGWFPKLSVWEGDVRLFDPSEYTGKVGCIHAGFPCQDISVAGKQAGVGEETRSGLYREVIRIADVVRPKELYLENVSAILSNGLGTVLADLSALGYSARWICLRASDVGANHGRDRWWLLARKMGDTKHNGQSSSEITGSITQGSNNSETWAQQTEQSTGSSEQPENVADTTGAGLEGRDMSKPTSEFTGLGEGLRTKQGGRGFKSEVGGVDNGVAFEFCGNWWGIEPEIGRVAVGVKDRVGKLKALGNGQVPIQAAVAYSILQELFNE